MAMTSILLVFIFLRYTTQLCTAQNEGFFWQISDLHLDRNYSIHGDNKHMCHGNITNKTISRYGNYKCDSPWDLIKEAISAMRNFYQTPDFILWTGDIMAHLPEEEINWLEVFSGLHNATKQILDTFSGHVLIPVIGNHDVYPANSFPDTGFEEVYEGYLKKAEWARLIPLDQHNVFLKGGYYIKEINVHLRIIVLNTNLYLSNNHIKPTHEDPGGQLQWLREQLISARNNNYTIIIAAHSPPGYFERNPITPFLLAPYSIEFIQLMIDYSDVILTQIYGHTHTDTFRLFMDNNGVAQAHGFIAPSVSPMKLEGTNGVNPSIRLYSYNIDKNMVLDYEQFYLNMSEVAPNQQIHVEYEEKHMKLPWKQLYRATELYGVNNLSLSSLYDIYRDISTNEQLFEKYYLYNSAGVEYEPCNKTCYQIHICAITELTKSAMEDCLGFDTFYTIPHISVGPTDGASIPAHHHPRPITLRMRYIILGVALGLFVVLILMTVVASVFCVRRKFRSGFRYHRHSVLQ